MRKSASRLDRWGQALGEMIGRQIAHRVPVTAPTSNAARTTPRGPGRPPKISAYRIEGERVLYKQGRGEFEAQVIRLDAKSHRVTLERIADGKRVVRPTAKIRLLSK